MPYSIYCNDLGVDCDHVSEGRTEKELFDNLREHIRDDHGMQDIPHTFQKRIDRIVKEDKAA